MSLEMAQYRCRICLEYCSETISVYDKVATGVSYLDITLKLTNQLKLDGSSNEPLHICVPCATMAKTAYNTKEPCDEADYKLEFNEEIITEEKVKVEKIKDKKTSNCSAFSVKEEIHIISKNEQMLEASLEHVTIEEALEVYYENPCGLRSHNRVVHKQEQLQCDYCEYVPESLKEYTKHVEAEHADKRTKNCNYCDKSFNDSRILKDHSNTNKYECYDCGTIFALKKNLANHLRAHIASKKWEAYKNKADQVDWFSHAYACKICNQKYKHPSALLQHSKVVHNSHDKSCYFCAFLPKSQAELKSHIKQEHADKKPWACKDCGKTFFQLEHLKCHLFTHKGITAKHMCNVCGRKMYTKSKLRMHMRIHTGEKPFSCLKCVRKFSCLNYLTKHMKTHERGDTSNSKKYECYDCGSKYAFKSGLATHLKGHIASKKWEAYENKAGQVDWSPYACKICDKKFKHPRSLRQHSKVAHNLHDKSCYFCAFLPKSQAELKSHIKQEHEDKKPWACKDCGKTFFQLADLKFHLLTHTGIEDVCDRKMSTKSKMRSHTGEKPFSCSKCEREFSCLNYLTKHMKTHERGDTSNSDTENVNKKYECYDCGSKFAFKSRLARHLKGHIAFKKWEAYENKAGQADWSPYACKICDKTFKHLTSLRQHRKVAHNSHDKSCYFCAFLPKSLVELNSHIKQEHADKKPWACKDCGKTFFQVDQFKFHLLTHTGINSKHMCNVCGRQFYSKSKMTVHMRSHTGEKPFSCSRCVRKFSCLYYLTRHMKTHERGDTSNKDTENVSKSVAQETLDTNVCKMCNRIFAHHSSLRKHSEDIHCIQISCCYCAYTPISSSDSERHIEKEHADENYFACDKCNGAFTSVQNLKAHLLRHNGAKKYECKFCDYKSKIKYYLTKHLRKHTREKLFQCSNCGKAFKQYQTMRIHLANQHCEHKLHDDNPKNKTRAVGTPSIYACKFCDKTFSSRARIRQHTKIVHKIKDTSCFFCDYASTSTSDLQKHLEKEHADKKTVCCEHCDKTFFDDTSLASHLIVHSSIVTHVCKRCGRKFATESRLIKHMITHTAKKSKYIMHNIVMKENKILFDSIAEFYSWKNKIEYETSSKFIQESSKIRKQYEYRSFICHRSGSYLSKVILTQKIRSIIIFCLYKELMAHDEAYFTETHVGHHTEIRHLTLTTCERQSLATKIIFWMKYEIQFATLIRRDYILQEKIYLT